MRGGGGRSKTCFLSREGAGHVFLLHGALLQHLPRPGAVLFDLSRCLIVDRMLELIPLLDGDPTNPYLWLSLVSCNVACPRAPARLCSGKVCFCFSVTQTCERTISSIDRKAALRMLCHVPHALGHPSGVQGSSHFLAACYTAGKHFGELGQVQGIAWWPVQYYTSGGGGGCEATNTFAA